MRDLEIRGAGNLLGPQQSGHITAVGFELYCQLLKQSISSLKGEKVHRRIEVELRLDFLGLNPAEANGQGEERPESRARLHSDDPPRSPGTRTASIPLKYISDSRQRIEVYRRLAQITDAATTEILRGELRDRFGPLPSQVELLLEVALLKVLASGLGITAIETKEDKLILTRNNDYIMVGGKFPRLTKKSPQARLTEIKRLVRTL